MFAVSSSSGPASKQAASPATEERLPVLLKPAAGDSSAQDLPSFEVRETSDGKLILTPIPPGEKATPFKNVFKQPLSNSEVRFLLDYVTVTGFF